MKHSESRNVHFKMFLMQADLLFKIFLSVIIKGIHSDCLVDLFTTPYSGKVSVTDHGFTCQSWSSQTPHTHSVNTDDLFPEDGSVERAENFCRSIFEQNPWCYTIHPDVRWSYCTFSICSEYHRNCTHELQSEIGFIISPDWDSDGLYDHNVDCLWSVTAPDGYVIRYVIEFFQTESSIDGCIDFLSIFEKGRDGEMWYCGSNNDMIEEGETVSNVLYVMFFADGSINNRGFYITYKHMKEHETGCTEEFNSKAGQISSPDRDMDGRYDFNLECLWIVALEGESVIDLQISNIDIEASDSCDVDYLQVWDGITFNKRFCGFYDNTYSFRTYSRRLHVEFVSNNLRCFAGFILTYSSLVRDFAFDDCLLELYLSPYFGNVSKTNHGHTCQAWDSQTPHSHPEFVFPGINGTAIPAMNYCRKRLIDEWPGCYTTSKLIQFEYCSFSICTEYPRQTCGGILTNETGVINSPDDNNDGLYDRSVDCLWKILAPEKHVIRFKLLYYEIESTGPDCNSDHLWIIDRHKEGQNKDFMINICGNSSVPELGESISYLLYVEFFSDLGITGKGFMMTYNFLRDSHDCKKKLTTTTGWIVCPDDDGDEYCDFNLDCQWIIEAQQSNVVETRFTFIELEDSLGCAKEYIQVSDDYGVLTKLCGSYPITAALTSRSNKLFIELKTNNIIPSVGFNLTHKEINKIFRYTYKVTNQQGKVWSLDMDGDKKYDFNTDCVWIINAKDGLVIRYTLEVFMIEASENCSKDSLVIYDEKGGTRDVYCGTWDELGGESLANVLYVNFISDEEIAFQGFSLSYRQVSVDKFCGGIINGGSGWITAPDNDLDGFYDFNMECQWTIETEQTKSIRFQMMYVVMEGCSKQYFRDEVHVLEPPIFWPDYLVYCGVMSNDKAWNTIGSELVVGFISDHRMSGFGFKLAYEEVEAQPCNYKLATQTGIIQAPDDDGDGFYDNHVICTWQIRYEADHLVDVEIFYILIEESGCPEQDTCTIDHVKDYLFVSELVQRSAWELFFTNRGRQAIIRSRGNIITVLFASNFQINGVGFSLQYRRVPKHTPRPDYDVTLLQLSSVPTVVTSNDYDVDGFYDYHSEHWWNLQGEDDSNSIIISILYLDIERTELCSGDKLQIGDVAEVEITFCGVAVRIQVPNLSSEQTTVYFTSDYTINAHGFRMKITQVKDHVKTCQEVLRKESGYIASIDSTNDGYYDANTKCHWHILLEFTKVIVFDVLEMDIVKLEGVSACKADVLEIFEDHKVIGKYCGNAQAPVFTTESNSLHVTFQTNIIDITEGKVESGKGFKATYQQVEDTKSCSSDYKCHVSDKSIGRHKICDAHNDCPFNDDERFCRFRCPDECSCFGLTIDCTGRYSCKPFISTNAVLNQSLILPSSTISIDTSTNHQIYGKLRLDKQHLPYLFYLNLSDCDIGNLHDNTFSSMAKLKILDLSFNKIRRLTAKLFVGLSKLENLFFNGNSVELVFEPLTFYGLSSLSSLELNHLHLENIAENAFDSLNLTYLKIYYSRIDKLSTFCLNNLAVSSIYLNTSSIGTFSESVFDGTRGIQVIVSDEYKLCCFRPTSVTENNCLPKGDELSSCKDLIKVEILRALIWITGLFSLLSNCFSIAYRVRAHKEHLKHCYGSMAAHLAVSDFLMGMYQLIIASADVTFRGVYITKDKEWRNSVWCKIAGFLAFVSSEASIFFICLITFDRFIVTKFPLGQLKLTVKRGNAIALVLWLVALILAMIPLVFVNHFEGRFYSEFSVCLPLPITRLKSPGWGYSFAIFIIFNLLSCLILALGQWAIFKKIRSSANKVSKNRSQRSKTARITINLMFVVVTNVACWLPVGLLGLLALSGVVIPVLVLSWFAVVVLPINAAFNPVLYTISEFVQKRRAISKENNTRDGIAKKGVNSSLYFTTEKVENGIKLVWDKSNYWLVRWEHKPDFMTLHDAKSEEWFSLYHGVKVAMEIARFAHHLSNCQLTQQDFSEDDIFVKKTDMRRLQVAFVCRPCPIRALNGMEKKEDLVVLESVLSNIVGKNARET